MSDALEAARKIAVQALNKAHKRHGLDDIMRCKFCTSMAAEMTIARHFEPILLKLDALQEKYEGVCEEHSNLVDQYGELSSRLETFRGLLQLAICPDCDGSGTICRTVYNRRTGDPEPEPEQCEFCDRRHSALQDSAVEKHRGKDE